MQQRAAPTATPRPLPPRSHSGPSPLKHLVSTEPPPAGCDRDALKLQVGNVPEGATGAQGRGRGQGAWPGLSCPRCESRHSCLLPMPGASRLTQKCSSIQCSPYFLAPTGNMLLTPRPTPCPPVDVIRAVFKPFGRVVQVGRVSA